MSKKHKRNRPSQVSNKGTAQVASAFSFGTPRTSEAKPIDTFVSKVVDKDGMFYIVNAASVDVVAGPFGGYDGALRELQNSWEIGEQEVLSEAQLANREAEHKLANPTLDPEPDVADDTAEVEETATTFYWVDILTHAVFSGPHTSETDALAAYEQFDVAMINDTNLKLLSDEDVTALGNENDGEFEEREAYNERLAADMTGEPTAEEVYEADDEYHNANLLSNYEVEDFGPEPDDEDVDDHELNFDIEGIDGPVTVAETATDESDDDLSLNMADMSREQILREIRNFYTLLSVPQQEATLNSMTDKALADQLYLLRVNNGGSFKVAELIDQVEKTYQQFLSSEQLKHRMNLLNQKASDHLRVLQRAEQLFGSDVTINGVKFSEYHAMLKNSTTYISTVTDAVYALAERMGVTLPVNEFMPNDAQVPLVSGMPHDPRVAMYVLAVFDAQIDKIFIQLEAMQKTIASQNNQIARLTQNEKRLKDDADTARKRAENINQEWERRTADASYFIIKDTNNKILAKIDDTQPLKTAFDLDLRGTYETALHIKTAHAAEQLAQRLMSHKRFSKRVLKVYRVSIVEEV